MLSDSDLASDDDDASLSGLLAGIGGSDDEESQPEEVEFPDVDLPIQEATTKGPHDDDEPARALLEKSSADSAMRIAGEDAAFNGMNAIGTNYAIPSDELATSSSVDVDHAAPIEDEGFPTAINEEDQGQRYDEATDALVDSILGGSAIPATDDDATEMLAADVNHALAIASNGSANSEADHSVHVKEKQQPIEELSQTSGISAEEESHEDALECAEPQDLSNLEEFVQLWRGRSSLSLQDYSLTSLEPLGLGSFTLLTTLSVAGNEFSDISELTSSLSSLKSLTDLDISRCRLRQLPALHKLKHLRNLDASGNSVRSSSGLLYCTELRSVVLCSNQLRRVEQLETLKQLEELRVSHNNLGPTPLAAFRTVSACTQLRVLNVAENPLAGVKGYQVQLMNLMPSLELIDGRRMQTLRAGRRGSTSTNANGASGLRSAPSSPSRQSSRGRICKGHGVPLVQNKPTRTASTGAITYGLLSRISPIRSSVLRDNRRYDSLTRSRAAHIAESPKSPGRSSMRVPHRLDFTKKGDGSPDHGDKTAPLHSDCTKRGDGSPAGRKSQGTPVRAVHQCLSPRTFTPVAGNSARKELATPQRVDPSAWPGKAHHGTEERCKTSPNLGSAPADAGSSTAPARSASVDRIERLLQGVLARRQESPARASALQRPAFEASVVQSRTLDAKERPAEEPLDAASTDHAPCSAQSVPDLPQVPVTKLDELLEEKRRLLRRVSAHIGAARVPTVAEPSDASMVSVEGRQTSQRGSTPTAVTKNLEERFAKAHVEVTEGQPCPDLQSLRSTLKDGIERKRLLLEQLRCI